MRDEFQAYYQSNNDFDLGKLWKESATLFVFDTNVLINLYRYKKETVDDFIKLIEMLEHRVFLPYHVGLEYHRNRLKPIIENRSAINNISPTLNKIFSQSSLDELIKLKSNRSIAKHSSLTTLLNNFLQVIEDQKQKIIEESKNISKDELHVTSQDPIKELILNIFENKLGKPPENQQWLDRLYKEGEERYKNEIPPGYKDQNKTDNFRYKNLLYKRKFGDLIIWKQILEYVSSNDSIQNVIFITDDSKEDWMYKINSQGDKIIGARIELIDEYLQYKQGVFSTYNSDEFIRHGNNIFDLNITNESINDIKQNFLTITQTITNEDGSTHEKPVGKLSSQNLKDLINQFLIRRQELELVHQEVKSQNSDLSNALWGNLELENDLRSIQQKIKNVNFSIQHFQNELKKLEME